MAISHCYWHLVVQNGYFTLLLTSSGQEWQLADLPQDLPADLPPNACWDIYYGMYLAAILDSQEKVGISCYFWIIRVVNSQLALYSHVRCNPLHTPQHPHITITNFNYEGSYLAGVICNIFVKADLSRSSSRSTPTPPCTDVQWSRMAISHCYWNLVVMNGD